MLVTGIISLICYSYTPFMESVPVVAGGYLDDDLTDLVHIVVFMHVCSLFLVEQGSQSVIIF